MLTGNLPKARETSGLVDLNKIRCNLKRWAATAKETSSWAELEDEELWQRLENISQIKRFIEKYCVDQLFREEFLKAPHQTIENYQMQLEPEDFEILTLIDRIQEFAPDTSVPISQNLRHYLDFAQERLDWSEIKEICATSSNFHFKAWRERQIARTKFQFNEFFCQKLVHVPVCFELSQGCSVGCPFCGISAPRLSENFLYTPENSRLWRQVLELMQETLGTAASAGFCYWATDPLDNPDYEKFLVDFYDILGIFPQTTTAQPLKDPSRLRSLLNTALEKGCKLNRFSILTAKTLDRVYAEFSPAELTFVGIVPQTPGARILTQFPFQTRPVNNANAGRLRERNLKNVKSEENSFNGTIACVSGFLFNMVDRSVKLISPCNASERWPLGYMIFDQGTFSDIDELKTVIQKMIGKHMSLAMRNEDIVSFQSYLDYATITDGFKLSTKLKTLCFRNYLKSANIPQFQKIGEVVIQGDKTAGEIANIFAGDGIPPSKTLAYLNAFFNKGVLDDEPNTRHFL